MDRKQLAMVFGLVVVAIAILVFVLATEGGNPLYRADDPSGDVELGAGPSPPAARSLADIVDAHVAQRGDEIAFVVDLATDVPNRIKDGELEVRWDLSQGGRPLWQVSATVGGGASASVLSYEKNFTVGTFDHSMPGGVELEGGRVVIRLDPAEIDGFPTEFNWEVSTALDGARGVPGSARAEDRAPDVGFADFPSPSPD
ncbi:MAG: hypothetical protein ABR575_01755 [Actinomycetota bacterium]